MFCPTCFQKLEVEIKSEVPLDAKQMPGVLREIASLIGPENAVKLAQTYGGIRIYVPKRMKPEHPFAELLGFENACALSAELGGLSRLSIPRFEKLIREARNQAILTDRSRGMSVRELALKYRVTEKHILNVRKAAARSGPCRRSSL